MEAIRNWETTHDTANRTMTHTFDLGFAVIIDWGNKIVKAARNGKIVSTINFEDEEFSIADYESLLLEVEAGVEKLKKFKDESAG